MKILRIEANNRRKAFVVQTVKGEYSYPYAKLMLKPGRGPLRVKEVFPDPEMGNEAFTYRLESGAEDTVHLDAVLEYNQDPDLLNELLLYNLTLEAEEAVAETDLSKRELIRALRTSPSQFYRLLDPTYYGKSVAQMVALLRLCGKEVEVVVREKGESPHRNAARRRVRGAPVRAR